MDDVANPFAPGAGTQPPELAGRDDILRSGRTAFARVKAGRSAKSQLLLGLRGVGKTVLLNQLAKSAEDAGFSAIMLEAPEDRRLAEMLVPPLRQQLFRLSRIEQAKDVAKRGLGVLRSFAAAFKVSVGDVEFGVQAERGTADSGSLEDDLPEMLLVTAEAAAAAGGGIVLLIDEIQYLAQPDLAALIVATHKLSQKARPFILVGAGLPQLAGLAGEAKSYAERLFEYPRVEALPLAEARKAIAVPIEREGAAIDADAVDFIVETSQGYPYFLQEWGFRTWAVAARSPITLADAGNARHATLRALDDGFFRVRFDRMTPREKDYVRAMAELGPGPHRSGEIADAIGMRVTVAAPLRSGLIKKGMIYSPQHGDTAFTVPLFDEFLKRAMSNPVRVGSRRGSSTQARTPTSKKPTSKKPTRATTAKRPAKSPRR